MMLTHISYPPAPLQTLHYEDMLRYLQATAWQQHLSENGYWYIFLYNHPERSKPVEIVFPVEQDIPDVNMHINASINVISFMYQESSETIVQRIALYEKDVWFIRNTETGRYQSLVLARGFDQIRNVLTVIKTAGSSETKALAYFQEMLPSGEEMVNHFRLGQTFSGGFGFTVESYLVNPAIPYQTSFDGNRTPHEHVGPIAPLERRVMERIARGLQYTQQAIDTMDISPLVDQYGSGFAANACQALAQMGTGTAPIEHQIRWSQKIDPAEDVAHMCPITLDETSADLLQKAAQALQKVEPQTRTIRGIVTHN